MNIVFCLEYTLPESTSLGGVDVGVAMPDSSQSLPPLMHMGYATRHPGIYVDRLHLVIPIVHQR